MEQNMEHGTLEGTRHGKGGEARAVSVPCESFFCHSFPRKRVTAGMRAGREKAKIGWKFARLSNVESVNMRHALCCRGIQDFEPCLLFRVRLIDVRRIVDSKRVELFSLLLAHPFFLCFFSDFDKSSPGIICFPRAPPFYAV